MIKMIVKVTTFCPHCGEEFETDEEIEIDCP